MFDKVKHAIDSLITLLVNSIVTDHDFFGTIIEKSRLLIRYRPIRLLATRNGH